MLSPEEEREKTLALLMFGGSKRELFRRILCPALSPLPGLRIRVNLTEG
jgi:hypothetical protein